MLRSITAKSRHVAWNLGLSQNPSKVLTSPPLTQYPSQSHFSRRVFSNPSFSHLKPRFLSHFTANSSESDTDHHSPGSVQNGDAADPPMNDSSVFSAGNTDAQLDDFYLGGDIHGVSRHVSHGFGGNEDDQMEHLAPENEIVKMSEQIFGGSVEEGDNWIPGDEKEEEKVFEVDMEKLENVLSLLQSSVDGSLETTLENMGLDLHEEFVVKVLETPHILGENLIRFFKWAIEKPDISVTNRVVDVLVRAINNDLRSKDVYALWDLINEIGERENAVLNVDILNQLLALFSRLGKGKEALEVLNKFRDFGCVPDSETYYCTIEALCRRRHSFLDWAWSVCEKMLNDGTLPNSEKVGKIVSWFCKGGKAIEAHSVYMLAKEKNKYLSRSKVNFLISSLCCKDEYVKLTMEMLDDFSEEARKHAIKPFHSVIRGLCRIKDVDEAKNLLSEMIARGPPPGNAVFNCIITGYSKAGCMKEAVEIMKLMESRGLKPDVYTYTVIMSGYVSGGAIEEACKTLLEAKKKHPKLTSRTYHTLIRGCCKLEQFDKALELFAEMKEFGVQPNVDEYNKLIQSLCLKALDWKAAEKLLDEMEENGLHLNGITRSLVRAVKELEEEELEEVASAIA